MMNFFARSLGSSLFIFLMSVVLANSAEDRSSIPGRVIPKTQKNGT